MYMLLADARNVLRISLPSDTVSAVDDLWAAIPRVLLARATLHSDVISHLPACHAWSMSNADERMHVRECMQQGWKLPHASVSGS